MRGALTLILCALLAVPVFLALAQEPPPVEEEAAEMSCRACHEQAEVGNQWGAWTESDHAKSFAALSSEKATVAARRAGIEGDPREAVMCLSCHAPLPEHREMGVSCEVCHGSGGEYAGVCGESFAEAMKAGLHLPGEKDCLGCHRPSAAHPNLYFEFIVSIDEVAHPRNEDEEARLFSTRGLYREWEWITVEDGLPHHIVFGVTPSGDDVWFATEDGVARLRDGKMEVWHEEDGLPHQAATQVVVDEDTGEVWVSTLCGIASFDGEKWTAYLQEDGLINNCAFGIALFGDDVWIATFDGIGRYNRKTKEWKKYHLDNAPLEEVWVYGVETDHEKVNFAVWGGGLVEYFPEADHFEAHHDPDGSFELNLVQSDGVISQMTTSVSHDNGWTWVASYFGMCGFDGRSWVEMDMDDSGLASNFINFVKARRGEAWFATDRGISCFDAKRDRWVTYRRLDGPGAYGQITIRSRDGKQERSLLTLTSIPYNFVWGIAFHGEEIWISTSDGVARGRY